MNEEMFAYPSSKKNATPKKLWIGIIAAAIILMVVVFGGIILFQGTQAKFVEGRTQYQGLIREDNPRFKSYLHYLKIVNPTGAVSENMLGGQQAVVSGEVANSGQRVIDIVEIRATLLSYDGKIIQRFIKTPIQPDMPLLPMEIRKFTMWVEPFPKEWLTGRVEVEINGFREKK